MNISIDIFFIFFLITGNIIQVYFLICMFLYLFLSFVGIFLNKISWDIKFDLTKKFAIIVPAHNEENVIANIIESLLIQNYPKENYDIYVVCDHCNDRTFEISKNYNINVLVHCNNLPSNKAKALNFAIDFIFKNNKYYDAFCFFDADSLAHPDFLKSVSSYLSQGYVAIQSQQIPKNPRDSFITKIVSAGQYITNRFFQKPKMILGLSATLHGKGMCFSRDIVKKYRWDETCLTEDLEMQMRLVRDGIFIAWAEKSIVYDEQPITISQYFKRSIRWTKGSLYVAKKHSLDLFYRFISKFDFSAFESFLYSVGVYRVMMIFFAAFAMYYTRGHFNFIFWFLNLLPYEEIFFKILLLITPLILLPISVWFERRISLDMIFAYYMQPFLGIFRIPIFLIGLIGSKYIIWDKVEHTSSVKIEELLKKEVI